MPCLHLYVTTRSHTQRVTDAGVDPSGEASAGAHTRRKLKREAERESQDEGSVDASLTTSQGKKDVARVSEGTDVLEDMGEQGGKPSVTPNIESQSLDDRKKADEADFIERVRRASVIDTDLNRRTIRRKLIQEQALW